MIYCIVNQINYRSSFNIFALIAGVLLLKSGIKTARIVRWASAFLAIAFIGLFFISPVLMPIDLQVTQIKLNPFRMLTSFAVSTFLVGVLVWVYFQLSKPAALAKLQQAGYKIEKPKSALYAALAIIIFGGTLFGVLLNSELAEKAKLLAQEQLGPNYKYHIRNLSFVNDHGVSYNFV